MNLFLGITIAIWLIQVVAIISDIVSSSIDEENGFIETKRHFVIALIPYFWVVLLFKYLVKWFNNLK